MDKFLLDLQRLKSHCYFSYLAWHTFFMSLCVPIYIEIPLSIANYNSEGWRSTKRQKGDLRPIVAIVEQNSIFNKVVQI